MAFRPTKPVPDPADPPDPSAPVDPAGHPAPSDATAPVPAYDRRHAWLVLVMIVAFMVVNYADKSVLGLAAGPIMAELGISKSTYGLVASSFYALFSLSGLVVGFLSARFSSRAILFAMTALWALAQLPVLVAAAVPALLAGRVLLGAAEGPAASMSMHALYKWFPVGRRGLPSALQISGAALGTLIAAPVLTWLISGFGWRSAFVALAVTSAVWSLVWLKAGRDGPYGEARPAPEPPPAASEPPPVTVPGTPRRAGPSYRRVLLSGTVLGSVASAFGAHWALALSSAWLPVYLATQLDMAPGQVATVVSGVSGLSFVLLLAVSSCVDVLRKRGVSSRSSSGVPQGVAVLVSGCAMALAPFAGPTALRLALLVVAFGCHAVAIPLHYMTTAEVVPGHRRGAVFGVVAATGTLPGLLVPFVTGRLVDAAPSEAAGYTTAFLLAAVVMLVSGAVALATIRPERDARRLGLGRQPSSRGRGAPAGRGGS